MGRFQALLARRNQPVVETMNMFAVTTTARPDSTTMDESTQYSPRSLLLSRLTATAESAGYNTPTETVLNSTGFRIVRVYNYRFGSNRRQE
jgi:hypothetical protein